MGADQHGRERRELSVEDLLATPNALLTRTHLRQLGLGRRAVDAVFRELPIIVLPGHGRPFVQAEDYLKLIETSTYRDDRVRKAA